MLPQTMQALSTAGEEIGIEIRPYPEYSGRGMYGRTTCAIVLEDESSLAAIAFVAGENLRDADISNMVLKDLLKLRKDNMGKDIIVY